MGGIIFFFFFFLCLRKVRARVMGLTDEGEGEKVGLDCVGCVSWSEGFEW